MLWQRHSTLHGCAVMSTPRPLTMTSFLGVQVYAQLLGEAELPWEGARLTLEVQRQLGVFRRPVLQLLAREPGDRISLRQFARDCESIFDSPSLVNTAPAAPDAPDAPAL